MTSEVDICNQALAAIGTRSTISSLTEDSPEARNCSLQYASTRDQLLRAAPWAFAKRYQALAMLKAAPSTPEFTGTVPTYWNATLPPMPWLYTYAVPSDWIWSRFVLAQYSTENVSAVPIFGTTGAVPYNFNGVPVKYAMAADSDEQGNPIRIVCTNIQVPVLCYTRRETNPDMFDSGFVIALIQAIAANIAYPLTGSRALYQDMIAEANSQIMTARAMDANDDLVIYDQMPDWLRTRGIPQDWQFNPTQTVWGPLFT